jgi:metal iron transporter
MAVAIALGRGGVDALLVASQVALSIVLPFVVFPLLYLTGSRDIMTVKKSNTSRGVETDISTEEQTSREVRDIEATTETVDYSNPKIIVMVGWLLWLVIVAANVYAIVSLGLGQAS